MTKTEDASKITGFEPEAVLNALAAHRGPFCRKIAENLCVLRRVHERDPASTGNILWQAIMLTAAGDEATRRWAARNVIGLMGHSISDYDEIAASIPCEELEATFQQVAFYGSALGPRDTGRG